MAAPRVGTGEWNRSLIFVVGVVSAVLIAGVFYGLMRLGSSGPSPDAGLQGAVRAGSPQFEEYKSKIFLDQPEATEAKRALGDIVMSLQTTVRNLTGKALVGLEIRGAVVDYEKKPIKERTVVVIPTRQAELAPNKTMQVNVLLDGMSDSDARANITMNVTAFK